MTTTGIKWLAAVAVLGLLTTGITANEYELLERFNNAFANYTGETELVLQNLRHWNSELIKEFNRELLLEMGRLVPTMRANDAEFLANITAFEGVSEECRYEVYMLRELFLIFQNWDIQDCAYFAWYGLNQDSTGRFWPYHNPFARENSRASFQVIQTLGRRRIDDVEGLEDELEEELEYYRNLRDGQTDILWDEISAHADAAYKIYRELDDCRIWSEYMQGSDHTYIMSYLENDCWYDVEVTTETTLGTTTEVINGTTVALE